MMHGSVASSFLKPVWVKWEDMLPLQKEWRALFRGAAFPNVFYGPDFLVPLFEKLHDVKNLNVLLLWRGDDMVAFAPLMPASPLERLWGIRVRTFTEPLAPCGLPLLHCEDTQAIAGSFLDAIERRYPSGLLAIDTVLNECDTVRSLLDAATNRARAGKLFGTAQRAALRRGLCNSAYEEAYIDRKLSRDLDRRERKLAALGTLTYATHFALPETDQILAQFLALEAAGWKGRQHSALASNPARAAFAQKAFCAKATEPQVFFNTLHLDGTLIAATLNLKAGHYGVTYKTTYDETLASYAPGILCDRQDMRAVLDEGIVDCLDSHAIPGHPLERLWHERLTFGNLRLALDGHWEETSLTGAVKRQEQAIALRETAKRLHRVLTGRKVTITRSSQKQAP
jgi:CelD/BcsL family acetyltransferase involved in cellulose biosynthesis